MNLTKKAVFRNSAKDPAVQLADMVMGAIGAHFDGNDEWFDLICEKGMNLGTFNFADGGYGLKESIVNVTGPGRDSSPGP